MNLRDELSEPSRWRRNSLDKTTKTIQNDWNEHLGRNGALAGLLAGFLGVGGGVVNVPLLVSLNVPIHYAVATSSFTITFTSITSATTHYTLGNVDLYMLVALTPNRNS